MLNIWEGLTLIRSRAWGSISGIIASRPLLGRGGNASLITEESLGQSASEGVPSTPNILPSWSISYWPGNNGLLTNQR